MLYMDFLLIWGMSRYPTPILYIEGEATASTQQAEPTGRTGTANSRHPHPFHIYRAKQRQAQMKGGDTEPRLPHTVEKLTNKGEIEKWQTKNYVA